MKTMASDGFTFGQTVLVVFNFSYPAAFQCVTAMCDDGQNSRQYEVTSGCCRAKG